MGAIKASETSISVSTLLSPEPEVLSTPLSEPNRVQVWCKAAGEWLGSNIKELRFRLHLLILRLKWEMRWKRRKRERGGQLISASDGSVIVGDIVLGDNVVIGRDLVLLKRAIKYQGRGSLPKKVYEGDSRNIVFDLQPRFSMPEDDDVEPIQIQETRSGLSVTLWVTSTTAVDEFLEFELVAAGFVVEGEKKQRQRLTSRHLRYQWNCYFPNSGKHSFAIVIRATSSTQSVEIGRIEHTVRVVKLDYLTQRQVWTVATLAGIVSGVLAFAEALHRLGLW